MDSENFENNEINEKCDDRDNDNNEVNAEEKLPTADGTAPEGEVPEGVCAENADTENGQTQKADEPKEADEPEEALENASEDAPREDEKKKRSLKKRRLINNIITAVLSVIVVVCVVEIAVILGRYKKANDVYEDIRNTFTKPAVTMPLETDSTGDPEPDENQTDTSDAQTEAEAPPIDPFSIDFNALINYNSDVVGWIYSENTAINYPVVQSYDNKFYERRGLDKSSLITGTIFVDYRCDPVGEDENYIIYGHHMRNGTIFGSLHYYNNQSYYEAHPYLLYFTPEKTYKIEVFAGFVTDTSSEFFHINYAVGERAKYIEQARQKSGFVSKVEVKDEDTIVTLATCSYDFENARFLLLGKVSDYN